MRTLITMVLGLACGLTLPARAQTVDIGVADSSGHDRPLNLDLELSSRTSSTIPRNWFCSGAYCDHWLLVDSTIAHHGTHSLRVRLGDGAKPPVFGVGVYGGSALKGSRLRVSAWVRTADLTGTTAIAVVIPKPSPAHPETTVVNGPSGTSPWTHVVLQLHPDTSVSRFTVFPRVTGVGTAWFDDLQFEINGLPITSDAPLAPLPTTAELASLRQLQRPLRTAEPGGSDDDLAPLDTIVGDAQVIALGESTHGTSEFHSLSDRIIRHLVRTKGINLVAMESDELAVAKLNHYVLTGAGDLEHARSGVWRVMRTREYAVLYEWLRQYDASKQGHVEIIGFDMQQPMHAIDSVEAFVRRTDPTYARSAAQNYARMRVDVSKFYMNDTIYSLGDSVYALWERGARAVLDHLRMRRGAMTGSDTLDIATAVHNADVALQGAADYGPQANSPAYRDSCMASNLLWQLAHRPGARVVMLAHYAHAARDEQTMGWYLDRALGDRYRPLMMTTNAGSYTGSPWYQMELRRYVAAPLDVGPPESIEGILHGLHVPLLLLDLRGQARDSLGSILGLRRTVRLIGFMTQDWTFGHWTLRGLFDALIFLERTHATTIVPCPGDLVCPP